MRRTTKVSKQKGRSKAVPVLGAAGLSLSLGGAAYAATTIPERDAPTRNIASGHEITLGEEEISDVNLGTFYVFDKENVGEPHMQLARGCGGCGGRGCGGGCRGCAGRGCGRGCGAGCGRGCGVGGCGCWGGCGCGCCLSWGGCRWC
jgi:hypothetical protein